MANIQQNTIPYSKIQGKYSTEKKNKKKQTKHHNVPDREDLPKYRNDEECNIV